MNYYEKNEMIDYYFSSCLFVMSDLKNSLLNTDIVIPRNFQNFEIQTYKMLYIIEIMLRIKLLENDIIDNEGVYYYEGEYYGGAIRLIENNPEVMPLEIKRFVGTIHDLYYNFMIGNSEDENEDYYVIADAYDSFIYWFVLSTDIKKLITSTKVHLFKKAFFFPGEIIRCDLFHRDKEISKAQKFINEILENDNQKDSLIIHKKLDYIIQEMNKLSDMNIDILHEVNGLKNEFHELRNAIYNYQDLIEIQISKAVSTEEIDRILSSYADVTTEKIVSKINIDEKNDYASKRNDLKQLFGDEWNKLEEDTIKFLVSAELMMIKQEKYEELIDYSGVCLLATKALENELQKRFCTQYNTFLKTKFGKDYDMYPQAMVKEYNGKRKAISKSGFTLGTMAYILLLYPDDMPEEIRDKEEKILCEFASGFLMSGKPDEYILTKLREFAVKIEHIKQKYRNPSAHTGELKKIQAKECLDYIIDVQQFLKKMLEEFD